MDNKQINHDWTLSETQRIPRKTDVVIDLEGNLGVVIKTDREISKRILWIENVHGIEIYSAIEPENFRFANVTQTKNFYLQYKEAKGWKVGKIYVLKDRDYPLVLEFMEFNATLRSMVYVFRDLNTPEEKFFKTVDESLLEFVEEWEEEATLSSFVKDSTSRLSHDIEITIRENLKMQVGWSVSGRAFSFSSKENAEKEIQKWIDRMRVRRVASVLSTAKSGVSSQVVLSNGKLYISEYNEKAGQPATFVSRVAAALAIVFLGEEMWKNALEIDIDSYDI